jgi:hypothetical protein
MSSPKQYAWTGAKGRRKLQPDDYYVQQQAAREKRERERAPRRAAAHEQLRSTLHRQVLRSSPDAALRLITLSDNANRFQ